MSDKQFKALLDALCYIHNNNFIHRDVRPDNILTCVDDRLLLVDFGFAVQRDKSALYAGTVHYASDRILDLLARGDRYFECIPADDVESALRAAFIILHPQERFALEVIPKTDFNAIKEWWKPLGQSLWHECLKAARRADYIKCGEVFQQLTMH
jgi:serine/threonine protein kinase